jgi:pyruvate dehydrogenase phosphatase regulatory subunit
LLFSEFICYFGHFFADSPDYEEHYGLRPYRVANTNTFGKPPWFDIVESEYTACRETVGLSDYSSFTKMDLWVRLLDFTLL